MKLEGKSVAILVDRGFEDLEFWVPYMRLIEEGASVIIVGSDADQTYLSKSGGLTAKSEKAAAEITAAMFDGVVIPGGWAPDRLRRDPAITDLVRSMYEAGKIIALICHAGSVAISAGIVEGHKAVGSQGIKDDLTNAGAQWVDEAAFQDGNLVWGRVVKDIPYFCRELISALERA